ncbi:hypothetical protein RN001_005819 [Aquatica leii]|uniref:SAP domain-containing protein n=1 Tax=Aquatica leii TaxID=1421715 RepID=A0AAN7Q8C4_9COLE|nr:hypothetical protein RN001_005819 [Aquatica leii]
MERSIALRPVPGAVLQHTNVADHSILQLQRWLECRGLKKSGNKLELLERVQNCINAGRENDIFLGIDGGKWT